MATNRLTTLGSELEALEAETFEVLDYAEFEDQLAEGGCSCSSTSTSSTTSSTGSSG